MALTASTTLPSYVSILLENYSEQADYGVLRTDMDGALAKTRPRYSTPIVTKNATLFISSKADYVAWRSWFGADLHGGSDFFNFTDDVTQTSKVGRFVDTKIEWKPVAPEKWMATVKIETLGL